MSKDVTASNINRRIQFAGNINCTPGRLLFWLDKCLIAVLGDMVDMVPLKHRAINLLYISTKRM